jgi:hypothetical protein
MATLTCCQSKEGLLQYWISRVAVAGSVLAGAVFLGGQFWGS